MNLIQLMTIKMFHSENQLKLTLHNLMKMEPTQSSETSAFNTQTPRKYPEDYFSLKLTLFDNHLSERNAALGGDVIISFTRGLDVPN
jgi:hypothetical protein